jgi:peptide/nickel transport system substrate-binding protein
MLSQKQSSLLETSQEASTLNPITAKMMASLIVQGAVLRNLNVLDENVEWVPQLAESIPSIENGQARIVGEGKYRHIESNWKIKDNAMWGDGTPVTGHDLVFSHKVALDPKVPVSTKQVYQAVKKIVVDKENPKKFKMIHDGVSWSFAKMGDFFIVPKHLEEPVYTKFKDQPDGYRNNTNYAKDPTNPGLYNGPFTVAEVKFGSHITLKRNPKFFGKEPQLEKVVIKLIPNTSTLEANLRSGTIDMINSVGISFDQALSLNKKLSRGKSRHQVNFRPSTTYEHIELNLNKTPALQDKRVRHALMYGLDREAMTQSLFEGKQQTALHFFAPTDPWYTNDPAKIKTYSYNPRKAMALLEQAGFKKKSDGYYYKDGNKLQISMMSTAGNKVRELVQVFIQNQYKQVGIDLTIKNEPARVFFGQTTFQRKFSGMAMFAFSPLPEDDMRPYLHSNFIPRKENGFSGNNVSAWNSKKLDGILEKMQTEFDAKKRKRLAADLMSFYTEEVQTIPLYYRAEVSVTPKSMKNYRLTSHKFPSTNHIENWKFE